MYLMQTFLQEKSFVSTGWAKIRGSAVISSDFSHFRSPSLFSTTIDNVLIMYFDLDSFIFTFFLRFGSLGIKEIEAKHVYILRLTTGVM